VKGLGKYVNDSIFKHRFLNDLNGRWLNRGDGAVALGDLLEGCATAAAAYQSSKGENEKQVYRQKLNGVRECISASVSTWQVIEKAAKRAIKFYEKQAKKDKEKSITIGDFVRLTAAFAGATTGVSHAVAAVAHAAALSSRNGSAGDGAGEASASGSGRLVRSSSFHASDHSAHAPRRSVRRHPTKNQMMNGDVSKLPPRVNAQAEEAEDAPAAQAEDATRQRPLANSSSNDFLFMFNYFVVKCIDSELPGAQATSSGTAAAKSPEGLPATEHMNLACQLADLDADAFPLVCNAPAPGHSRASVCTWGRV
jgi:hypothetical protein